jgi:hypothetical protein
MAKPPPDYARLDAGEIIATAERQARRIAERFPGSGLAKVAARLVEVARRSEQEAAELLLPNVPVRVAVAIVLLAGIVLFALLIVELHPAFKVDTGVTTLVQAVESTMNIAVLVGLGVVGLTRLESRRKRGHALASLHMLRSLAHVIDMHQLAKDPDAEDVAEAASGSPKQGLPPAALERYLDFCADLLALIGKLSALYAQSHGDQVVGQTVNEIEGLTTNLSRKIWQKIAILAEAKSRYRVDAGIPALGLTMPG